MSRTELRLAGPRFRDPSWLGYTFAFAAVALVSAVIAVLPGALRIANISMLYLIAVLATAVAFGSGPAVVASLLAFLVFDWFFVEPLHQFTVADPQEWVALLLFLATAVVTGQLAAGQRRRAEEAKHREREASFCTTSRGFSREPSCGRRSRRSRSGCAASSPPTPLRSSSPTSLEDR